MATIYEVLVVAHDETSANAARDLYAETGYKELAGLKIVDFLKNCVSGAHPNSIKTQTNAVKATGTITLSAHVAADTVTVNGVTLTADTDYAVGGTDTLTAVALAAAINANSTLDGMVVATSSGAVVTVTAISPGELGNAVTLAISAHGSVSGARMTGGTNGTYETTHFFGSAASTLT